VQKKISIIVPCRNEVKYIKDVIDCALESDYPKHLIEILVMDGMSDDGTRELLSEMSYKQVTLIDNPMRTTPHAFNIGIRQSSGDYILILSARVLLSKNYLSECARILNEKNDVYCVGNGNCENLYDNDEGKIIAKATDSKLALGFGNPRKVTQEGYAQNCDTQLYRKETFEIVGMFDETLTRNQDDEFNFRLIKSGLKIYVTDKISIQYYVRSSFKKLFRQYFQYGYWKVFVNKKHRTVTTIRQLVPSVFILFILSGLVFFQIPTLYTFWYCIMIFYFLITFMEGVRLGKNIKDGLLIQYAFFNFHFGYGMGYLKGMLDFLILNKNPSDEMKKLTR
jgi:glycosyltransferase involved in cell wall biosynthesis